MLRVSNLLRELYSSSFSQDLGFSVWFGQQKSTRSRVQFESCCFGSAAVNGQQWSDSVKPSQLGQQRVKLRSTDQFGSMARVNSQIQSTFRVNTGQQKS
ncbi:hypothetical protein HanOQP8_Chr07g0266451 [Helianthus annuus]|nr:hypothetical protein HanOQP8_Chr07g0266451 [Helianthus annuus]